MLRSKDIFVDIHNACLNLKNSKTILRIEELSDTLPSVAFAAMGGFPFLQGKKNTVYERCFYWCGIPVTKEFIREKILEGLGFSAVLTFTNKNDKSLIELGEICKKEAHLWAFHWLNFSVIFSGHAPCVEKAFARDCTFKLSWAVADKESKIFIATGSLKEWLRFIAHQNDLSFDVDTRNAMTETRELFLNILYEYTG